MVVATDVKDVSLMVQLPDCARSNSDLLEFYSDLHGAWQTLPSFWRDARTKDLDKVIKALDGKLKVLMKEVVDKKGANWGTVEEIGLTLYHDVVPDDVRKELRDAAGNPGPGHAPILRIHLPIKLARIP